VLFTITTYFIKSLTTIPLQYYTLYGTVFYNLARKSLKNAIVKMLTSLRYQLERQDLYKDDDAGKKCS